MAQRVLIGHVKGDQGPKGDDGLGVPPGGSTHFILKKKSAVDNDVEWTGSLDSNSSEIPKIWGSLITGDNTVNGSCIKASWIRGSHISGILGSNITGMISGSLIGCGIACSNITGMYDYTPVFTNRTPYSYIFIESGTHAGIKCVHKRNSLLGYERVFNTSTHGPGYVLEKDNEYLITCAGSSAFAYQPGPNPNRPRFTVSQIGADYSYLNIKVVDSYTDTGPGHYRAFVGIGLVVNVSTWAITPEIVLVHIPDVAGDVAVSPALGNVQVWRRRLWMDV